MQLQEYDQELSRRAAYLDQRADYINEYEQKIVSILC